MSCSLCFPAAHVICRTGHWTVVLNDDQGYLGRCYFALNRHETDVTRLSVDELTSVWHLFAETKGALDILWQPDHYNYVFLMNVQPHLHGHIIPRYAADRNFSGLTFRDGALGSHYSLDNVLIPDPDIREVIAAEIRFALPAGAEQYL